jgi:hypothetical protein
MGLMCFRGQPTFETSSLTHEVRWKHLTLTLPTLEVSLVSLISVSDVAVPGRAGALTPYSVAFSPWAGTFKHCQVDVTS